MKQGITTRKRALRGRVLGAVGLLMASGSTIASAQLAPVTAANLGKGINLGNTLDALPYSTAGWPVTTSQETNWGNPVVNQQIFNGFAAAGFKNVRITVSWLPYMDRKKTIQPFWLARVKEVVDMARNAGLYVIINNHEASAEKYTPIGKNEAWADDTLNKIWTQVANHFKNYDNHLLFAGTNEIHDGYGTPTATNCRIQTEYNQVFVDAVRATGGNNATRTLVFQGYNTNIDNTIDACGAKVPTDSTTGRLIIELHFYVGYNFSLNDTSNIWQWGSIAEDPTVTEAWDGEAHVEQQFDRLKTAYTDKGISVVIGEYCAISKTEYDPSLKYRDYWDKYVTGSAIRHGFATQYWDTGSWPNHNCGIFNRSDGSVSQPTTLNGIITAQ
jgi:endoglucanase